MRCVVKLKSAEHLKLEDDFSNANHKATKSNNDKEIMSK